MKSYLILLVLLIASFSWAQEKEGSVFYDNFNDNSRNWLIANEQGIVAQVHDGKYYIEHQSEGGAGLFWNYNCNIDPLLDFEITTSLKQLSGNQNYGYGLTWGGVDGANFFAFTISSSESINIYKFEDGTLIDLLPMTVKKGIIKTLGFDNRLTIRKSNGQMSFFINDSYVHAIENQAFLGQTIGYVLNSQMKVAVEDLTVYDRVHEENTEAPLIVWFSPAKAASVAQQNDCSIEIGVKSDVSLNKIALYVNNEVVGNITAFNKIRGNDVREFDEIISEEVLLFNGMNEIKVVLEDLNGKVYSEARTVKVEHDEEEYKRHDHALIFACNEYDFWNNLVNPISDAESVGKDLEEIYGFEVEIVRNASASEVMSKIKQYSKSKYNPKDQLLIFFAGHGKYDKDFGEGYVVCKDSKLDDDGNITYLSHSNLRTSISHIPCDHIFLMMDVCFGGTFDRKIADAASSHRGAYDSYEEFSKEEYIFKKLRFKTRKYVTSGGDGYVDDGVPGEHSPFVRKILEGFRSEGGEDRILTTFELFHFLEKLPTSPRYGEFRGNEPGSEFLFITKD